MMMVKLQKSAQLDRPMVAISVKPKKIVLPERLMQKLLQLQLQLSRHFLTRAAMLMKPKLIAIQD